MVEGRALRADARRNRQRVLEVAAKAFAMEGLTVSVQEIARRAGVGTGTVSRHFPTKEALFEAILEQGMDELIRHADALVAQEDPETAFYGFFDALVRAGAANRGFTERLAAAAADRDSLVERVSADVLCDRLDALLTRAQDAGAVRAEVPLEDVEALMVACMSRPESIAAMTSVVRRGLTP